MTHGSTIYLTTRDAGRLIDLTPAAIRRAVSVGLLRPVVVTSAGERLFSAADVLAYAHAVAARRNGTAGKAA